ncbi:Disease resistance protein (CC-NBS-LRR class) family [Rhynchospora pubera]|uniref:Disease resistance protein (CC-NBS-LRR class) family n=1 Tax=Rhynchospora pubera TaxID=906938 RepID=A0AAV8GWB3_9POAL|nr:Disease resistance protein (CC-NBS-LRR class) family [Rhynchospora pubera]
MESLVNFVVGKLGDLIVKEAQFLGGVGNQVEWVETELKRIQSCLIDADTKRRKGDARVENWLNELRDVAYRIEDAIDTFYVEIEDSRQKDSSGFLHKFNKLCCMPMKVPCLHKLGKELGQIRDVLDGISKSRVDYGIKELPQDTERGRSQADELPMRAKAYLDVDETKIVGLDDDKNNILNLLLNSTEIPRRAVITIVGPGGLGKTTLARMVYKRAKANFDHHIMLSVSQHYNLADIVRRMLNEPPQEVDLESIMPKLKSFLSNQRYLIILDDVWEVSLWEQLQDALPNNENGSRVMITSRSIDVAPVDLKIPPYKLNLLNDKDSLNLLLKTSLSCQEFDKKCPNELLKLADALSKKCKGLPLALNVLGGILSKKDQTYHAWKDMLNTLDWYSNKGESCMNVLAMSYEDMPYYLKPCFLHLACFPEDYEIDVRDLIRMWIAERILPQNDKKTLEETGEDCLQQLFERNMVQLSSPYTVGDDGRICRVHDLLRDLAIHEAEKINFVTIFRNPQDVNHSHRVTRRASLQSNSHELIKHIGPKTRSLLCFASEIINSLNFPEFRLLRVLEIQRVQNMEIRGLEQLIHLKYLAIQQCYQINLHIESSLGHLKNLETFSLEGTISMVVSEPSGLWTTSTLRHVRTPRFEQWVLPFNANLRNLQTIATVQITEDSYKHDQFPCLNSLRELSLEIRKTNDAIAPIFGTMSRLLSLHIFCYPTISVPEELVYPTALPNYQDLQSLSLIGMWDKGVSLEARLFPRHLAILSLNNSRLGQDPMPELGKLQSLKKLILIRTVLCNGTHMICPTGFPVLETLDVWLLEDVDLLRVEKGVMPKLKYFRRNNYYKRLKVELPPEIQHIIPDYDYFSE